MTVNFSYIRKMSDTLSGPIGHSPREGCIYDESLGNLGLFGIQRRQNDVQEEPLRLGVSSQHDIGPA